MSPSQSARPRGCPIRSIAVVIADVLVAEELAEDEPRVGASLADPAVGRDRLPGVTPFPS